MISFTPWPLYPREITTTNIEQEVGWAPGRFGISEGEKYVLVQPKFEHQIVKSVS
jgi:hypothetical protein